jgi:hypothetical protein
MKYIRKFNSQKLPGSVYIPIDLIGKNSNIKQTVLRICEDYAFCLSSKERVPFHILVEVMETKQVVPNNSNKMSVSPYGMSNMLMDKDKKNDNEYDKCINK